eukprot:jgi/Psemu1/315879/fgenesh1_kg.2512_\
MVKEFHLKQKFNLVADSFKITLNGEPCYVVKGQPLKLGSQASFQTMDGTELAFMKQTKKSIAIPWNSYELFKDGKLWATAKQQDWGLVDKKEISIDIPGDNNYKVKGDCVSWNFTIYQGDVKVGVINKKWGLTDSYGVRVEEGADEVDILMCGILIDATYHDKDH